MADNIVIVESPAKAKTIEKFLGKDYTVVSSFGHIRDLSKKNYGIEIDNNYTPVYEIDSEKIKLVNEIKKLVKSAKMVWLASDEDREGEAIAWHLMETLKLKDNATKRIVFHEITKEAILKAIENPRKIDINLVNAQQARRVLDRLVGFELSPLLWKKVKPQLSAGRVQSVSVRLIVDREKEIRAFKSSASFKVVAGFSENKTNKSIKAELPKNLDMKENVHTFLKQASDSEFIVSDITKKPGIKTPAPPFTTSTLQQEASRKLGFSVSKTMTVAQRLYESGKITYMRTDSVNLSDLALNTSKSVIEKEFGEKYFKRRKYTTKSKGAQEAHEAIRPTYLDKMLIEGNNDDKRLYDLIWKRTVASQMSDAKFEKTNITIDISKSDKKFIASGEVLIFDGFLKLYIESSDDESKDEAVKDVLPAVKTGEKLNLQQIVATEKFTHYPPRYSEASLVRKMEELGIGRPSTYAPTISTIQTRGYVVRQDKEGTERKYLQIILEKNKISELTKTEIAGNEKSKLFPTDIGGVVNDFLIKYFDDILDFNFTASIEKEFDEIAEGKKEWTKMVDNFYKPFHKKIENTLETSEKSVGEKLLGTDPVSRKNVFVKIGKYGPIVQLGDKDETEKPKFASLLKNQNIDTISLSEALELFKLPRKVGEYEGKEVVAGVGKFGPYIRHDSKFFSIGKTANPLTISLDESIRLISDKRTKDSEKLISKLDEDLEILNGRYGPYICYQKINYRIPKTKDPKELTKDDCMEIIKNAAPKKKK